MADESGRAETLKQEALDYHEFPKPGKLEIRATKPLSVVRAEEGDALRERALERTVLAD